MKTIKIMIAASEEMHEEKLEFSNLIKHLNEVLEPRGIELARIKWNPENESSIEDYQTRLSDCEICLKLYWRKLPPNSEQELNTAYEELRAGHNPKNLYVFFKEPDDGLTDILKDFKANFVNRYGHFFCKFENADTMNLHFILQFEAYQNHFQSQKDKLINVTNGKVKVGDKEFVNLGNVPFAALNKEYQRLQKELLKLDIQVTEVRKRHKADPDNEDIEDELTIAKSKRKEVTEEFEKYQAYLYDIALSFAKQSIEQLSDRMLLAWELFEKGDTTEADLLFNLKQIMCEDEIDKNMEKHYRYRREIRIEELSQAAKFAMANSQSTISERFSKACEAYKNAISIARDICYDERKFSTMLFGFAELLQTYHYCNEASEYYLEIITKLQSVLNVEDERDFINLIAAYCNLANQQFDLNRFSEVEASYKKALDICHAYSQNKSETYMCYEAHILNGLANLYTKTYRYEDAESMYQQALKIRKFLEEKNPNAFIFDVAQSLNGLGSVQDNLHHYNDAEASFNEALYYFRLLEKRNHKYARDVAITLGNLSILYQNMNMPTEAECSSKQAWGIFSQLLEENPDIYLPDLANALLDKATLHFKLGHYNESEKDFEEAIKLYRNLIKDCPDAYMSNLIESICGLAELHALREKYSDAENEYRKSIGICRQLAQKEPERFMPKLATILYNYSCYLYTRGDFEAAEKDCNEALSIFQESEHPNSFLFEIAESYKLLAMIIINQDPINSTYYYEMLLSKALSIFEQLDKETPNKYSGQILEIKNILPL